MTAVNFPFQPDWIVAFVPESMSVAEAQEQKAIYWEWAPVKEVKLMTVKEAFDDGCWAEWPSFQISST